MTETSTCTRSALLAAVVAEPDDDTVRLAFADFLQENPLPDMPCPECAKVEASGYAWTDFLSHATGECYKCGSPNGIVGTVPDDLHERWSELIRVQCELARPVGVSTGFSQGKLAERIDALLPALRARLMPPCPGPCKGEGLVFTDVALRGDEMARDCPACSGSGVCPGTLSRGFPVLNVPLACIGREVEEPLYCTDMQLVSSRRHEGSWTHRSCGKCENCKAGTKRAFQPSGWARAAKWDRGATFQPAPVGNEVFVSRNVHGDWFILYGSLPIVVIVVVENLRSSGVGDKNYPTEPAALSALATALNGLIDRPREEATER